ncbi:hypothetical protein RIB2604_01505150 [Aspergillus luchuensis]|uniref:Uncharacterized protein n=1 Tax=Aspergillus kawachii TaxID=1069201 RepID=A0A146FAD5_ASPKA|nr:hypothetical protein RIB2604_01505150 [Aspergillus luchuensis]
MDDLRGRGSLSRCWMGGRVEERPGGECVRMDGRSSRGRGDENGGSEASCLKCSLREGSSTDRRRSRSLSEHLFRQLEPSLFFNGHTTSLLTSVTEKELVSDARGGMVCMDPSWRGGLEGQASEPAQAHKQA